MTRSTASEQKAHVGELLADHKGRAQPVVGVFRRHPDVDDRHVRFVRTNLPQQILGVARLGDDFDSRLGEQPDGALPQQHGVVGDHYAHGISARSTVPSPGGLLT